MHRLFQCTLPVQILAEAQQQLKAIVQSKVQEAIKQRDHDAVVRFTRLHIPLRLKVNCATETGTAGVWASMLGPQQPV